MPFNSISSILGVDFNNISSTQLFALGTKAFGTNNTEWVYVKMTGAAISGEMCSVASQGTARPVTTTAIACSGPAELAWAQGAYADQDYGWVALRGDAVTVLMSSTCVPNTQLYWASGQARGALTTTAGSASMAGIQLLASSSTASLVLTTAILTYPRCKYTDLTAQ